MSTRDDGAIVRRHLLGAPEATAPVVERVSGPRVYATDGSIWLDAATGGFGVAHPGVTARIAEQASRVALSSRVFASRPLAEAVAAVHDFCPRPLAISYLCNSGAEALDAALKLAKGTHPERRLVLGFAGADHGALTHGQSLTRGHELAPDQALRPMSFLPERADDLIARVDGDVAAVVLAPAAPGRPVAALGPAWWARLSVACHTADALLVLDERLTGPARTGTDLATSQLGIVPDALVLGEALGADVVPVGCMVASRARFDRVYWQRNPTLHGSTFGANPLSAAAVTAVLSVVTSEGIADRQKAVAEAARQHFADIPGPGRPVSVVHADGSLIWLRTADAVTADALVAALAHERVLVRPAAGDVVAVLPPLTSDPGDIDDLFTRVAAAAARLTAEEAFA